MKFFVSQWVTATNDPYHVVAYSATLPAKGELIEQRQEQPVADGVEVLSEVMGGSLSRDRYAALLPAVSKCLRDCDCTTVNRIAMWCAQIGHESGGLKWMQEIADGSAYEGRRDLGNTQPGDGHRFKGHGPIQVTGAGTIKSARSGLSVKAWCRRRRTSLTILTNWPQTLTASSASLGIGSLSGRSTRHRMRVT